MRFSFAKRFASLFVLAFIATGSTSHANPTEGRFVAEAFLMSGSFCPGGYSDFTLRARGQYLPNRAYSELYEKLGIAYGGDGRTVFSLPVLDAEYRELIGLGDFAAAPVWCINRFGDDLSQASVSSARVANLILALPDSINECPAGYKLRNDVEMRRFREADPSETWKLPLRWCEATSNTGSVRTAHYYGELILVNGSTCPSDFKQAGGSMLSVASNDVLFSIIGTTYGGDGADNFALPDMSQIFEHVPGTVWCIEMDGYYPSR